MVSITVSKLSSESTARARVAFSCVFMLRRNLALHSVTRMVRTEKIMEGGGEVQGKTAFPTETKVKFHYLPLPVPSRGPGSQIPGGRALLSSLERTGCGQDNLGSLRCTEYSWLQGSNIWLGKRGFFSTFICSGDVKGPECSALVFHPG